MEKVKLSKHPSIPSGCIEKRHDNRFQYANFMYDSWVEF